MKKTSIKSHKPSSKMKVLEKEKELKKWMGIVEKFSSTTNSLSVLADGKMLLKTNNSFNG